MSNVETVSRVYELDVETAGHIIYDREILTTKRQSLFGFQIPSELSFDELVSKLLKLIEGANQMI